MTCNSTTHHTGCACHEQRHAEEIAALTASRDEWQAYARNTVRDDLKSSLDAIDALTARVAARDAALERAEAEAATMRGEIERLRAALLSSDEDCIPDFIDPSEEP